MIARCRQTMAASAALAIALAATPIAQRPTTVKPRIAVFSGPNATIQNNKPLVTSNKAREQYGLPVRMDRWGRPLVDWPRYQRLAAPVTVYIEMFTAHPLESDARELYAPPDGYVDSQGRFSPQRKSATDKPVYAVTLEPEDGLYALPYMGRQANGQPWESALRPGTPLNENRQTFLPDASRIFEEIERNGGEVSVKADYDFYRAVPSGGYSRGLGRSDRTDIGTGDTVDGLLRRGGKFTPVPVTVKTADGQLVPEAIPKVIFVKGDHWFDDSAQPDAASDRGIEASIDMLQEDYPLAGIVAEGLAPYATLSAAQDQALLRAVYRGIPVVKTARGDAHGLVRTIPANLFIEGNNLTATKARLLLTAAMMKFGALPHAADPEHPTSQELDAIRRRIDAYQQIFQTH
jgi:hypothetical protein